MKSNKFTKLVFSQTRVTLFVTRDYGCRSKQDHSVKVFHWQSQLWLRLVRMLMIHLRSSGFRYIERE